VPQRIIINLGYICCIIRTGRIQESCTHRCF